MSETIKRIISLFSAVTIILSILFPVISFANNDIDDIKSFVENVTELVQEYDADKEFVVLKDEQFDFQTCRLIVRSNGGFDAVGAAEIIDGFQDYSVLQYHSELECETAYYDLLQDNNIYAVSPDSIVKQSQITSGIVNYPITDEFPTTKNGHLCDWGTEQTQSSFVVDYINERNLSNRDIVVAVVDSGVDYNHEFLKDRIVRTHYNATSDGYENDEFDTSTNPDDLGHGTMVSSVILDNSPQNVQVANYRVFDDEGKSTLTQVASTILKIVEDKKNGSGADVINLSLSGEDSDFLVKSAIDYAYDFNIPIIASSGNEKMDIVECWSAPALYSRAITVGASDNNAHVVYFTNRGIDVDLIAPGFDVNVAYPDNRYWKCSGTSFACPAVSGAVATILSIHPDWSIKRIEDTLKANAVLIPYYDITDNLEVTSLNNWFNEIPNLYGSGLIQLGWLVSDDIPDKPTIEGIPDIIVDNAICTLSSNDNSEIYYTLDGTFPNTENGELFTDPFVISEDVVLRAVCYNQNSIVPYGPFIEEYYSCYTLGTDDMFSINEQGCITSYIGTVASLVLPNTINGVEVKSFVPQVFNNKGLQGIVLADGIQEVPDDAFKNTDIQYINTAKAAKVGNSAFESCEKITSLDLPEVIEAGDYAFYGLSSWFTQCILNAPKLETIGKNGFIYTWLYIAYLPKLKEVSNYNIQSSDATRNRVCFLYAPQLESVKGISQLRNLSLSTEFLKWAYVPKLNDRLLVNNTISGLNYLYADNMSVIPNKKFPYMKEYNFFNDNDFGSFNYESAYPKIIRNNAAETIGEDAFGKYYVERLEMGNLHSADSLPQNADCIIALSSKFESCNEETAGRNYKIYGFDGSKAEVWAKANGHTFIPLSKETAIYADIDAEYYGWGDISFDVIGYNKTYTWYGCDDKNGKDRTKLCAEHYGYFSPLQYDEYPYYCCVCTIKDQDSILEIESSLCKNLDIKSADYSEYNAAVEKANSLDRNEYVDFSAVDEALSKDISGKNITEQIEVDKQTEAILKAIETLKKKDIVYEIVQGANSTFDISKDTELVVASNAEFEKFVSVFVDDVELDKSAYTAKSGSTVITLTADYLKTLALKEHRIIIRSTDGYASTVFTVIKSDAEESTTKPDGTTSPSTTKLTETTTESTTNKEKENTTVKRDNSLFSPKTGNNFSDTLVYVVALSYVIVGLLFVKKRQQKIN